MKDTINLFELGCLVQLSIGYWSGRKALTRDDLRRVGIDPGELPEEIISLGRKLLVPKEEILKFNKLINKARGYLANWSIPFGIGSAQFVPAAMLAEVQARLSEMQAEYCKLVDSFVERFDLMRQQIQSAHPLFWANCLRQHYPASPKALRRNFYFNHFVFRVAGLGGLSETGADEAYTAYKISKEREAEMREQMKAEVDKFVEEAIAILRRETVDFCDLVIARVNNRPYRDEETAKEFPARTLHCFKKYVERFRQLNIFGDEKVEQMLVQLKQEYFDGRSPADLQSPDMAKAVTETCEAIRTVAQNENGEMSEFLSRVKRKIEL